MFLVPFLAHASFNTNLQYGQNGSDIYQLQDVLIEQGDLKVSTPTGYFGLLTLDAVKSFQSSNGISSTGYVGSLTRSALNQIVDSATSASSQEALQETGTTTPSCPIGYTCAPISQQIKSLSNQVATLQNTVNQISQSQPIQPGVTGVPQAPVTPQPTASFSLGTEICRGDVGGSVGSYPGFVPIVTTGTFSVGQIHFLNQNNSPFGYTFNYQNIVNKNAEWYILASSDGTPGLTFDAGSYTYTWQLDNSTGSGSFTVSECAAPVSTSTSPISQ